MLLAHAAIYTLSPKFEAGSLQMLSHQFNDILFRKIKLHFYGFEGRAVLPGQFQ